MDYPKSVPGVGLVNGKFVDENPVTGSPGSLIPADWGNAVTDELLSVIQAGGLEPSETSREQVLAALRALFLRVDAPSSQRPKLSAPAPGDSYNTGGALEIREAGLVGESQQGFDYAPRILFHWAGLQALALAMDVEGQLWWANKRLATTEDISVSTDGLAGTAAALKASAGGASATVSVSADAICVKDSAGRQKVIGPVALSINSAAAGVNGLDSGALAASTWYSVWVVWNGANAAGLLSLSATAPTLPAGYTHKARVGWIRTDATANKWPLAFRQVGKSVAYVVAPGTNVPALRTMASGPQGNILAPTYVPVSVGAFVPPTAVKITLTLTGYFSATSAIAAPNPNHYKITGASNNAAPLSLSQSAQATHLAATGEFILESGNVYFASTGNPTALLCNGWEDEL